MDYKVIKEFIQAMNSSRLSALEITSENFKIKMKNTAEAEAAKNEVLPLKSSVKSYTAAEKEGSKVSLAESEIASTLSENITVVTSDIVGSFHSSKNSKTKPYVDLGSRVRKGDVLCMLEALRVMNEVRSEIDGEVCEILAKDGQLIEYGQVLFKIKSV